MKDCCSLLVISLLTGASLPGQRGGDEAFRNVHLVCNAHIDPVWLWEWEEGAATAISTFRVAADLCEKFDDFVFNHNEAILYQWVEEYEPALFKRIQDLVARGKWHIMGGWYLQPDCNLPSGESFVRQIILGRNYFEDKFNVRPSTAINFDPFGHSRGLVQIMAKAGYDPRAAIPFWERMKENAKSRPLEFLSTHPAPERRIEDIRKALPEALEYFDGSDFSES